MPSLTHHLTALAIKFVITGFVLILIFPVFYSESMWGTIVLTAIITVGSYVLGDLALLRISSNLATCIFDFAFVTGVLMVIGPVFYGFTSIWVAMLAATLVITGEFVIHKYVQRFVFGLVDSEEPSPVE
ncbi:hypothetical protein CR205_02505 [Alteribacter lacisalsi]|jgi:hypothetical protein|uniref:DUF2512 family protein n=1 Tax=Alteribacter lacisalsi TaxID=2045244 RepID=A0A2W0H8J5_9BACI|nr:DUF2512 family protein [Alteribacter lacisalsi]PYZ97487.1 hypothetical protein CR205_02505 [Alteribacter lacisalsi]